MTGPAHAGFSSGIRAAVNAAGSAPRQVKMAWSGSPTMCRDSAAVPHFRIRDISSRSRSWASSTNITSGARGARSISRRQVSMRSVKSISPFSCFQASQRCPKASTPGRHPFHVHPGPVDLVDVHQLVAHGLPGWLQVVAVDLPSQVGGPQAHPVLGFLFVPLLDVVPALGDLGLSQGVVAVRVQRSQAVPVDGESPVRRSRRRRTS